MRLAGIFCDRMVVQRDRPVRVWGKARPGERVEVTLGETSGGATAGASGDWSLQLPPRPAARGLMLIAVAEEQSLVVRDVAVGEVWLCAGQSNMAMTLAEADDAEHEIEAADDPDLRWFDVDRRLGINAVLDPTGGWVVATPQTAGGCSAVAYHLGRGLRRELGVTVGLVHASWGGTAIESWVDAPVLVQTGWDAGLEEALRDGVTGQDNTAKVAYDDPGPADHARDWASADFDDDDWAQMRLPCFWGDAGLDHNGAVWFRKWVEIPEDWSRSPVTARLGPIHDHDRVYLDGQPVGMTDWPALDTWRHERAYELPAALLNPGRHLLAIRVFSRWYHGGFRAHPEAFTLSCEGPSTPRVSLAGPWRYAVERALPPVAHHRRIPPTAIFNGMVAGVLPFALGGVAWYQGESNVDFPRRYRSLLKAMIGAWRRAARRPMLPFAIVQLPEFGDAPNSRFRTPWHELREVQAQVAAELPGVACVSTDGLGDVDDVHPTAKRQVGERLASAALDLVSRGCPAGAGATDPS